MDSAKEYCTEDTPLYKSCIVKKIKTGKDVDLEIEKQGIEYKIIGINTKKQDNRETCVKLHTAVNELYLDSLLLGTCKGNNSTDNEYECDKICRHLSGNSYLKLVLELAYKTHKHYIGLQDEAILYEHFFGINPSFSTIQLLLKKRTFYEGYGYLPVIKTQTEISADFAPNKDQEEYINLFTEFIDFRTKILTSPINKIRELLKELESLKIKIVINDEDKLQTNLQSLEISCGNKTLLEAFSDTLTFKNDKSNNTEYKKHKNIFYDIYEIINECFSNFNFMSKYYYILDDTFNKKILEIYKTNSITINDEFLFKPSEQLGGIKQVNYRNRNKKNTIKKKIKIKRLTKKL